MQEWGQLIRIVFDILTRWNLFCYCLTSLILKSSRYLQPVLLRILICGLHKRPSTYSIRVDIVCNIVTPLIRPIYTTIISWKREVCNVIYLEKYQWSRQFLQEKKEKTYIYVLKCELLTYFVKINVGMSRFVKEWSVLPSINLFFVRNSNFISSNLLVDEF